MRPVKIGFVSPKDPSGHASATAPGLAAFRDADGLYILSLRKPGRNGAVAFGSIRSGLVGVGR
jgi:hypothetical protein